MAKGLRSSVKKTNRSKLRKTLYGPVVDARTERLSAKLQELISKPPPSDEKAPSMDIDNPENENVEDSNENEDGAPGAMDIEEASGESKSKLRKSKAKARSTGSDRITKRGSRKRSRAAIVFPQNPHKAKRLASKRQTK